mmetsp:Transcript_35149/g.71985  ORF Transcript_35149/g.71985 Transcript_35149/m.71985 type:complete len:267 (-) Transcript_35149:1540-2340(-)
MALDSELVHDRSERIRHHLGTANHRLFAGLPDHVFLHHALSHRIVRLQYWQDRKREGLALRQVLGVRVPGVPLILDCVPDHRLDERYDAQVLNVLDGLAEVGAVVRVELPPPGVEVILDVSHDHGPPVAVLGAELGASLVAQVPHELTVAEVVAAALVGPFEGTDVKRRHLVPGMDAPRVVLFVTLVAVGVGVGHLPQQVHEHHLVLRRFGDDLRPLLPAGAAPLAAAVQRVHDGLIRIIGALVIIEEVREPGALLPHLGGGHVLQ